MLWIFIWKNLMQLYICISFYKSHQGFLKVTCFFFFAWKMLVLGENKTLDVDLPRVILADYNYKLLRRKIHNHKMEWFGWRSNSSIFNFGIFVSKTESKIKINLIENALLWRDISRLLFAPNFRNFRSHLLK